MGSPQSPVCPRDLRLRFRSEVAEFEIIDTGIGIAEADLARIFEPFQRGANSHAPSTPGVGLGLTICKTLVEVMGGEISVTNRLGEGSRFRVRLLLSGKTGGPAEVERRITGRPEAARPLRVLVADDDDAHRALVADLLAPLGFEVRHAVDGAECLALTAQAAPDIFLLDIAMPGMTGWELARRLREEHGQTAPIIMVSANALELGPPGERQHHDHVLPKPLSLAALLEKIG